jgi:outer membrane scaffolding protein for murein synthesis (MipA/OmpV family)
MATSLRAVLASLGLTALALACRPAGAEPQPQPLWELGLGVGALVFNDYRGASTSHVYPAPVPYFIYRGQYLRADRDGVHGRIFNRRYLEFEVSVNATAPVFSRSSAIRKGMPNLEPTIELGPALRWHLWRSADEGLRLDLRLPVREAITVTSPPQAIGVIFAPSLDVDYRGRGVLTGWNFGALAGPLYAQQRYHEYFYGVAPAFATPTRPAYEAAGGYSGSQLLFAASRRFANYWVGAYLRHDWLAGAVFDDSPLVQQRSYWAGGVGFVWMISASSRMVESRD